MIRNIMKRDMDLIRKILLITESDSHGFAPQKPMEIDGYTQEEIGYHIHLLGEADLAKVINMTFDQSDSPSAQMLNLTWNGHEFLDSSHDNHIWNQAKDAISKLGGASIQIWTALLIAYAKKELNL